MPAECTASRGGSRISHSCGPVVGGGKIGARLVGAAAAPRSPRSGRRSAAARAATSPGRITSRVAGRLVEPVVDADHALELGQRVVEPAGVGRAEHRVAGDRERAPDLARRPASRSPRRGTTAGTWPSTSGAPRTRAVPAAEVRRAVLRGRRHRHAAIGHATGLANISPPATSKLPVRMLTTSTSQRRERAELLVAQADAAVDHGPLGRAASSCASRRMRSAGTPAAPRPAPGVNSAHERRAPRRRRSTSSSTCAEVDEPVGEEHVARSRAGTRRRCRA